MSKWCCDVNACFRQECHFWPNHILTFWQCFECYERWLILNLFATVIIDGVNLLVILMMKCDISCKYFFFLSFNKFTSNLLTCSRVNLNNEKNLDLSNTFDRQIKKKIYLETKNVLFNYTVYYGHFYCLKFWSYFFTFSYIKYWNGWIILNKKIQILIIAISIRWLHFKNL